MSYLTAESARILYQPAKLARRDVFFPVGRVNRLREILGVFDANGRVDTEDARVNYEWNQRVMARPLNYAPLGPINPWNLDDHYGDDGSSNALQLEIIHSDFESAVDLAVRYLVTGEEAAGAATVRILHAWASITGFGSSAGSVLNWNNKWPLILQAALMVKNHPAYTSTLDAALRQVTERGMGINVAITHDNNWGAWGVCYLFAAAVFTGDRELFDTAIQRWRTLFDIAVVNNVPVDEVYRQGSGHGDGSYGLWYSNFFLSGMTIAAEWARFGGAWLYDYEGVDGSTFKGLYENIRHWSRYPAEYPYNTSGTPSSTVRIMAHDDILHALWPDPESQWLLDNFPTGSVRDNFGMRQAVLAYRYRPLYG